MNPLRRKNDLPAEPAPEQGAALNLRNPDGRIKEWDAEATKSEAAAQQDAQAANQFRIEAEKHAKTASDAAAEEMRLLNELDRTRQTRQASEKQRADLLTEAQKFAERAKFFEDKAADLRTTIASLQQQAGVGQVVPSDPAADTRTDEALARIDAARAELPAKHREEETAL